MSLIQFSRMLRTFTGKSWANGCPIPFDSVPGGKEACYGSDMELEIHPNGCRDLLSRVWTVVISNSSRVLVVDSEDHSRMIEVVSHYDRRIAVGILVENVVDHWLREMLMSLIPFFRMVNDAVMSGFLSLLSRILPTTIFNTNTLSSDFAGRFQALQASQEVAISILSHGAEPVLRHRFVGHGAGGLIAKGLGVDFEWDVDAFEAPPLANSLLGSFFNQTSVPEIQYLLSNFHSGASLVSRVDSAAGHNHRMPPGQKFWGICHPD